jgi:hypothetical protein
MATHEIAVRTSRGGIVRENARLHREISDGIARVVRELADRVAYDSFGEHDEGPEYEAACLEEESALQALSRLKPITGGGARALLKYMAKVEGCFVRNTGSPLLKTVFDCRKCAQSYRAAAVVTRRRSSGGAALAAFLPGLALTLMVRQ